MSDNDFKPDWDTVKAYEDKFTEMLDEIQRLRAELKQTEARLHEVAKYCAELEFAASDPIVGTKTWFNEEGKIVQQELKRSEVYKQPEDEPVVFNTLSSLRHKKTVGPIESAMTGRPQTTMQPCAGRNCGSTNPNLHSAECFEDYEKSTGMSKEPVECMCGLCKLNKREWVGLTDKEIKEIIGPWGDTPIKGYTRKLFDQIEAKLKEKNNG